MSLLQKILGLEYNDIINYQIKRKKIKFNSGDRFFFELFINHPLLQRAVMQNHTLTLEYLHGEPGSLEVRDISKFPEIPLLLYTSPILAR